MSRRCFCFGNLGDANFQVSLQQKHHPCSTLPLPALDILTRRHIQSAYVMRIANCKAVNADVCVALVHVALYNATFYL